MDYIETPRKTEPTVLRKNRTVVDEILSWLFPLKELSYFTSKQRLSVVSMARMKKWNISKDDASLPSR